jgi:glycosyltransferase involved in cell wall biosynthesis
VRNEVAFISKLISSLQNQTYSNWVLHIRDNASTDGTDSIIRQFQRKENRIHMTSSPIPVSVHVNWAYAINEALLISSDFASCIAGDDYYEKSTHLESLVAAIHDSVMCALPQFRLNSDTINISMPTKASPESMRRNHFRLSAGEVYVMAMYWFALEALRSAQSVPDETYIKFVKGIGHTSAYYNPESKEASLLPRNVNTKIFSMFRSLLFEAFVDPPKFFLSSYKRVSLRDLLWIPLFLLVMSGSRFGKIILLSIKFLWKPDGFRTRFRNAFKTSTGR